MLKYQIIIFSLFLMFNGGFAIGQTKSFQINVDKLDIDANDPAFQNVKPGDTLLLVAGNKDHLLIKNFQGASGKPIIIMNSEGEVIIDTDNYYGISIQNCRYLRFTGSGNPDQSYGFQVKRVSNGAGLGIGYLSSDIEIDHVSIENTSIGGIYAKTDPDCTLTSVRGTFTQYNTIIHDNYIANTGNEGMYIGSSQYFGQTVLCNGLNIVLMPSLLDGVKIYNNIVKNAGWDGIQVTSASNNCQIYNNTILFDSQAGVANQMSGILIGGGTKCDCYNNFISQGNGDGIDLLGLGGCRIFNNIILDAGLTFAPSDKTKMKHGIFVGDTSVQKDSAFYIQFNDIINPKSDGIRFASVKSKNNLIASNVIINPGNYDYYQTGTTSFKGVNSYIMLPNPGASVLLENNYLARNADSVHFASSVMQSPGDFKQVLGSPLIDRADIDPRINFDFEGTRRPFGVKSDIGAFELIYDTTAVIKPLTGKIQAKLLLNPVTDLLVISLSGQIDSTVYLNIYNLKGELVIQSQESKLSLVNPTIEAHLQNISSGVYIYAIRSDTFNSSGKFIKL